MAKVETVILYRPGDLTPDGDPIEVNPAMVGAIEPYEKDPNKTLVNIFGVRHKVRGRIEKISALLGWQGERHPLAMKGKLAGEKKKPVAGGKMSI